MSSTTQRALPEWAVLGLLSLEPAHPFAAAKELSSGGSLGRVMTVRRPLVYRAVERLRRDGLISRDRTEPGEGGPNRTVYRITDGGREALGEWLEEPVNHVRDLRLEFLLKLRLMRMLGVPVEPAVRRQLAELRDAIDSLEQSDGGDDDVDRWRRHNARAARGFLEELADFEPG